MKIIICLLALILVIPTGVIAAEVSNLKVGQSGDKGFATFDLRGEIGERETEVAVSLTISGRKYDADKLTLKGDFGNKVKTGVGKRIVWDTLTDIPSGYDGEVTWSVDAVVKITPVLQKVNVTPAASPDLKESPFIFGELVARDKNTGLSWLRMVSKDGKGVKISKARGVVKRLKEERYAGCSEWRIPFEQELKTIISYATAAGYNVKKSKGYPADYFNMIGFNGVANDYFWTESAVPGEQMRHRLAVDLEDGNSTSKALDQYLQNWPVCTPD